MSKKTSLILFFLASTFLIACTNPSNETEPLNQFVLFTPSAVSTSNPIFAKPITTERPTVTLTATRTSTVTPSPVPPLSSHTWETNSLLITFGGLGGDGGQAHPPELMLYPDGHLIVGWMHTWLDRQGACQLLNTIDQTGFFDYDPSTYQYPFEGGGIDYLLINSWKENNVEVQGAMGFILYDNYKFFDDCDPCPNLPTILPSLRKTYTLLNTFRPESLEPLTNDILIMWVGRYSSTDFERFDKHSQPWELPYISLEQIVENSDCGNIDSVVTFDGTWAQEIRKGFYPIHLSGNYDGWFSQNGGRYRVRIRSAFPNEVPPSCQMYYSDYIPDIVFEDTYEWACTPEDGVLEIPES